MLLKKMLVVIVLSCFALSITGASATAPPPAEPPYTGVIKNQTKHEVNVPARNSQGTITVPPKGWVEYTVWNDSFDLIGYVNGNPYYCQKINVDPKKYQLFCKSYDFVAEIKATEPAAKKKLKKRIKRKKPGPAVEGLG